MLAISLSLQHVICSNVVILKFPHIFFNFVSLTYRPNRDAIFIPQRKIRNFPPEKSIIIVQYVHSKFTLFLIDI